MTIGYTTPGRSDISLEHNERGNDTRLHTSGQMIVAWSIPVRARFMRYS